MMYQNRNSYPINCLGELGNNFAQCIAHNAQAKHALIGPVVLAAMSAAVHGSVDILTPMHSIMPTSLYICVVAASGMRKSTVADRAFHGFSDFEDGYVRNTIKEFSYQDLGSHPYLLEDASESGIVDHCKNGAKASALLMDEGGMLKGHLDSQRMCKRFDGSDLRVTRHSRMVLVRDTRMSFCMTIQDPVFDAWRKSKEGKMLVVSGLMPRFLISYATHSVEYGIVRSTQDLNPFSHPFHDRVKSLMRDYQAVLQETVNRKQITLSLEAQECLEDARAYWNSLRLNSNWRGLESFLDRAAEQAMRVSAVLQCFNEPSATVAPSFMESAVDLVNWHLYEANFGFGERSEEELQVQYGQELYAYILKKLNSVGQGTFSRIDLLRKGPVNLRKADKLDLAIDQLLLEDKIVCNPVGQYKFFTFNATPNPENKKNEFSVSY